MKKRLKIDFNAPVILIFTAISLAVLICSMIFGDSVQRFLSVYYTSWTSPLMYMRMLTHVVTHADLAHFTGNIMMILVLGPLMEEKYGSKAIAQMICVTALVTGLIHVVFFRGIALLGASGIVFMFILLASFTNIKDGKLPITVILVAVLYIGNEIANGILTNDNISQLGHVIGGLCGGVFGWTLHGDRIRKRT